MKFQTLRSFLKQTFMLGLVLSLTVFAWLRLIFFEVPFSVYEDGTILLKTILCGWLMMSLLKAGWLFMLFIGEKIRNREMPKLKWQNTPLQTTLSAEPA